MGVIVFLFYLPQNISDNQTTKAIIKIIKRRIGSIRIKIQRKTELLVASSLPVLQKRFAYVTIPIQT
ncbi:MAG TPA: hypothetical protein PK367_00640 [Candidatus Paceibacterota bacterium]|nr:hypothetical protein [Candidatus Paceibacterota bacterium]